MKKFLISLAVAAFASANGCGGFTAPCVAAEPCAPVANIVEPCAPVSAPVEPCAPVAAPACADNYAPISVYESNPLPSCEPVAAPACVPSCEPVGAPFGGGSDVVCEGGVCRVVVGFERRASAPVRAPLFDATRQKIRIRERVVDKARGDRCLKKCFDRRRNARANVSTRVSTRVSASVRACEPVGACAPID